MHIYMGNTNNMQFIHLDDEYSVWKIYIQQNWIILHFNESIKNFWNLVLKENI